MCNELIEMVRVEEDVVSEVVFKFIALSVLLSCGICWRLLHVFSSFKASHKSNCYSLLKYNYAMVFKWSTSRI